MVLPFQDTLIRWLRKAERITYTDNVYLAKNFLLLGGSQALAILNGFVIYILIGRLVDPALFGEYKYLVSLFELSAVTSLTGMKIALTRSVANGFDSSLIQSFRLRLRVGYALGCVILVIALWYAVHATWFLAIACVLIFLLSPLTHGASGYGPFLQGKKHFKFLAQITLLNEAILFLGMITAVYFAHTALVFFVIFLIVTVGPMVFWYLRVTRLVVDTRLDPELLPHGKHQSLIDVLGVIASRIDSILVFHYLGAAEVALYAFATLTAEQLKIFVSSTYTIAGPKFASNSLSHTLKTFRRKMFLMGLLGLGVSLVYFFIAPWMYRWFFPNYIEAAFYSRIYAFSLIFTFPTLLGSYLLNIKGLRRETMLLSVASSGVLISSLLIGGYLYGLWGVVYSRIFSSMLQCAMIIGMIVYLKRRHTHV